MSEKNGSGSFWTTLPGVLTGVATLITAVVGLYAVFRPAPQQPILDPVFHPATQGPTPDAHGSGSGPAPTPEHTPPDYSTHKVNNNDPGISYRGACGYNHGLSALLYNDDVQICSQQGDSFTYTFTGQSIYLETVYHQGKGGTISCYIDNSLTQSFNLNSNEGVDNSGFAYGVVLPIAPRLVYGQHTASCKMTSGNTLFYIDALIINK